MDRAGRPLAATVILGAFLGGGLGACASSTGRAVGRSVAPAPPATTISTDPTPSTAPGAKPPPEDGLGPGDHWPAVAVLQQRLAALHYDVGDVDGAYGDGTLDAVMAFEKVMGLPRTGRATNAVLSVLAKAGEPAALRPGGGSTRVEIDVARQVLFLYVDGALYRILPVSTGFGGHYCDMGQCGTAITPGGSYRVYRRIGGWYHSPLGLMYNPLFFNEGIAIHGSYSVPAYPASHGCIRIPVSAAEWFPSKVADGTPVYVLGTPDAPISANPPATAPLTIAPSTTGPPATAPPTTPPPTTVPPSTAPPRPTATSTPPSSTPAAATIGP